VAGEAPKFDGAGHRRTRRTHLGVGWPRQAGNESLHPVVPMPAPLEGTA
jgi:hypothetical protein